MEISSKEGVGLKPIPQTFRNPLGVSAKNLKPKEGVESSFSKKRASREEKMPAKKFWLAFLFSHLHFLFFLMTLALCHLARINT